MRIPEFKLEKWLNPLDEGARYNLGASCVKALTVDELFALIGEDKEAFLHEVGTMSLHYGHFSGLPRLKAAIAGMYEVAEPGMVLTAHGGTAANNMVISELVEPADNVVCLVPNYQMHYSIPESIGAEVRKLELRLENDFLPDLSELERLVDGSTRMIIFSNPNNPTGSYMGREALGEVVAIAERTGAYILSDEIYRGLDADYMPSVVDLYDRGIATSSTSKVFSMAGTRLGWIVVRDGETFERLENRRSYTTICEGVFDELVTAVAFEHFEEILGRSRKIVDENRAVFDSWLLSQPRLMTSGRRSGTTAFVRYDYDIDCASLCRDLYDREGVLLCHGDCFDIPKALRIGYGFGDAKMLSEGLAVLGGYLKSLDA